MTLPETLAALNATLNATAAVLIIAALVAIKRGRRELHGRLMTAAVATSAVFLVSYLTRYYLSGDTPFAHQGPIRAVYFTILISHVLLATTVVPLVLRTVYLALRKRFPQHRQWARYVWPIWIYVSVTGVTVYLMLYHYPGRG